MTPGKAKVFWVGSSQLVRLPRGYRLPPGEVAIRRVGPAILLEPAVERTWPEGYLASFAGMPADFMDGEPT